MASAFQNPGSPLPVLPRQQLLRTAQRWGSAFRKLGTVFPSTHLLKPPPDPRGAAFPLLPRNRLSLTSTPSSLDPGDGQRRRQPSTSCSGDFSGLADAASVVHHLLGTWRRSLPGNAALLTVEKKHDPSDIWVL